MEPPVLHTLNGGIIMQEGMPRAPGKWAQLSGTGINFWLAVYPGADVHTALFR